LQSLALCVGKADKKITRCHVCAAGSAWATILICNASRTIGGETINAGGDCGYAAPTEAVGLQRSAHGVAGGEQFILVLMAAAQDGPTA